MFPMILTAMVVFHGAELLLLFAPTPLSTNVAFANQLTDFYINFVYHMNPGGMPTRAENDFFP